MGRRVLAFSGLLICGACVPPGQSSTTLTPRTNPTSCATAPVTDTSVFDTTEVTERPVVRAVPKLNYPEAARRHRIQGRVVIKAIVNADGTVDRDSVTVENTVDPDLDAEARRFVTGATTWPACRDGHPVRVRVLVPVTFAMTGQMISFKDAFLLGFTVGMISWLFR